MSDLTDIQIHFVETLDEAQEFLRWLGTVKGPLAVDTETHGLDKMRHNVRLIQFGNETDGWALGWFHWAALIIDVLRKWEGEYVFHNAKFDTTMIENTANHPDFRSVVTNPLKIPRHKCHDTAILANILDPSRTIALKPLCEKLLNQNISNDERLLTDTMGRNGWGWDTVPIDFPPYWLYGSADSVRTKRLFNKLYNDVHLKFPEAYDLEMSTMWVLQKMEKNGFPVDTEYAKQALDEIYKDIDQIEEQSKDEFHCSPGKNQEVIARLKYYTDYEFTKKTKGGALSIDKDVLEDVIETTDHPLSHLVSSHRKKLKICQSYLRRFTGEGPANLAHDGRVHVDFNGNVSSYGARTGRIAVSNPPLHQLPRADNSDNEDAKKVRGCFTSSPGHKLILCDYDQFEARIFASISKDPGLIDLFKDTTKDPFLEITREVFNDPSILKKDPRRQRLKNWYYSQSYGAGDEKQAATAGLNLEEFHEFIEKFNNLYPGVDRFMNAVIQKGRQRAKEENVPPYVKTLLTRRHLPADSVDKAYTLVNFLIQGSQAEILKTKLVELDKEGFSDMLLMNVHDEIIFNIPDEDVENVSKEVVEIMSDDKLFEVPITCEATASWCWGLKNTEYANEFGRRP